MAKLHFRSGEGSLVCLKNLVLTVECLIRNKRGQCLGCPFPQVGLTFPPIQAST
jgi:hypothetical protein